MTTSCHLFRASFEPSSRAWNQEFGQADMSCHSHVHRHRHVFIRRAPGLSNGLVRDSGTGAGGGDPFTFPLYTTSCLPVVGPHTDTPPDKKSGVAGCGIFG